MYLNVFVCLFLIPECYNNVKVKIYTRYTVQQRIPLEWQKIIW